MLKFCWCVIRKYSQECPWDYKLIDKTINKTRKATRPKWSRMMPPPGLQFYLRSRMTLTFDLLTPKLVVSCPYNGHLYSVHLFSRYRVHKVGNRRTDGRTDKSITLCLRCQSGLAGHENRNCSLRATRLQVYAVSSGGGVVVFVINRFKPS